MLRLYVVRTMLLLILISYDFCYKQAFVKMCCKKKRGLSMGETDKELRKLIQCISGGRYLPPCKKTALDCLIHMNARQLDALKVDMNKLRTSGISPSISGKVFV